MEHFKISLPSSQQNFRLVFGHVFLQILSLKPMLQGKCSSLIYKRIKKSRKSRLPPWFSARDQLNLLFETWYTHSSPYFYSNLAISSLPHQFPSFQFLERKEKPFLLIATAVTIIITLLASSFRVISFLSPPFLNVSRVKVAELTDHLVHLLIHSHFQCALHHRLPSLLFLSRDEPSLWNNFNCHTSCCYFHSEWPSMPTYCFSDDFKWNRKLCTERSHQGRERAR